MNTWATWGQKSVDFPSHARCSQSKACPEFDAGRRVYAFDCCLECRGPLGPGWKGSSTRACARGLHMGQTRWNGYVLPWHPDHGCTVTPCWVHRPLKNLEDATSLALYHRQPGLVTVRAPHAMSHGLCASASSCGACCRLPPCPT